MSAHVVLDEDEDGWVVEGRGLGDRPVLLITQGDSIHVDIGAPGDLTVTLDAPEPVTAPAE